MRDNQLIIIITFVVMRVKRIRKKFVRAIKDNICCIREIENVRADYVYAIRVYRFERDDGRLQHVVENSTHDG